MTRFARAKGSKASNERLPEDGTQWSVMKKQMEQNEIEKQETKKRKEFEKKRHETYQAFLSEQKQPFTEPAWAEFSDNEDSSNQNQLKNKIENLKVQNSKKIRNQKKNKVKENGNSESHEEVDSEMDVDMKSAEKIELKSKKEKKKSKKVKKNLTNNDKATSKNSELGVEVDSEMDVDDIKSKEKLQPKSKKQKKVAKKANQNLTNESENSELDEEENEISELDEEEIDKFCDEINSEENAKYEKIINKVQKTLKKLENPKKRKLSEDDNLASESNNIKKKCKGKNTSNSMAENENNSENGDTLMKTSKNTKKKSKNSNSLNVNENNGNVNANLKEKNGDSSIKSSNKSKNKKKKLKTSNLSNNQQDNSEATEENQLNLVKNKIKSPTNESLTDSDDDAPVEESIVRTPPKIDIKIKKNKSKTIKIPKDINSSVQQENNDTKPGSKKQPNLENQKTSKKEQIKTRRKPESDQKQYVVVNGEKQEIVLFAGFPVKKSDAERLQKLKEAMIKKGIPRKEVFHTMKLERRKAEKSLTRDKKKVCFQCRQSGHLLSDCPQIGSKSTSLIESTGTGICYKCGSTEHNSFDCRVVKDNSYKFAKCFICGEQGHISRQCPDNPKGLYPQGGGCRICGDVTHLKKDCPQFQQKQEDNTITLNTLTSFSNVEDDFEDGNNLKVHTKPNIVKQKIVKF